MTNTSLVRCRGDPTGHAAPSGSGRWSSSGTADGDVDCLHLELALERGAIEGEIFHRGAVQALAPGETQVTPRLAALGYWLMGALPLATSLMMRAAR